MNLNKNYILALVVILMSSFFFSCSDDEGDSTIRLVFDHGTNFDNKDKYEVTNVEGSFSTSFYLDRETIGYNEQDRIRSIDVIQSHFYFIYATADNVAKDKVMTINVVLSIDDAEDHSFDIDTDKTIAVDLSSEEYKKLIENLIDKIYRDKAAKLNVKCTMYDADKKPIEGVKFIAGVKAQFDLHVRWIGDINK